MIDSKLNSEHQTLLKAMELHSLRETKVELRFKKKKKGKKLHHGDSYIPQALILALIISA